MLQTVRSSARAHLPLAMPAQECWYVYPIEARRVLGPFDDEQVARKKARGVTMLVHFPKGGKVRLNEYSGALDASATCTVTVIESGAAAA